MSPRAKRIICFGIPLTTLIGIIACFGDDAVGASINPALASIGQAFPDIPYSQILWLYSLPKIVIVPLTLIAGLITGRYVSYRVAAIVGFGLIAFGGMLPTVLDDFWLILASRFILGIGLAIQAPIGPALVLQYFPDNERRATVLGIGHGFINLYGVITNLLVGGLCDIDWHFAFLSYGTIFILLILAILFVKEPPAQGKSVLSASQVIAEGTRKDKEQVMLGDPNAQVEIAAREEEVDYEQVNVFKAAPKVVYVLVIVYCLTLCVWGVAGLNLSAVIQDRGFGTASTTGLVISLINLSGVISGMLYGLFSKCLKNYVMPFGYFLMGGGGFIVYCVSGSVWVLALGVFLAGMANTIIMTTFEAAVGARCSKALISFGMSLCMVASQLSGFITPFYESFIMDYLGFSSYTAPVAASAVLLIIGGAIMLMITVASNKKKSKLQHV